VARPSGPAEGADRRIGEEDNVNDFLSFRRMITPLVIQAVFWVLGGLAALAGLVGIFTIPGWMGKLMSLVFMVLGPLMVRIWCEFTIIYFRMNETLTDILNAQKKTLAQLGGGGGATVDVPAPAAAEPEPAKPAEPEKPAESEEKSEDQGEG
jgi:hypothetical protein